MLKYYIIIITTLLVFGILLLMLVPTNGMLAFGTMILPGLIVVLAYLILKSNPNSTKEFNDDNWYDNP
jgi:hypothetical protein